MSTIAVTPIDHLDSQRQPTAEKGGYEPERGENTVLNNQIWQEGNNPPDEVAHTDREARDEHPESGSLLHSLAARVRVSTRIDNQRASD